MSFLSELMNNSFNRNVKQTINTMGDDLADTKGGLSSAKVLQGDIAKAVTFVFDRLVEKGLVTDIEKKEYITWRDDENDNTSERI